jgi:DNA-binding CsgD family transcriptional regulator
MTQLSPRQRDVLRLLIQGKPYKVIARDLSLASGTVHGHLHMLYLKLGVNSQHELMAKLMQPTPEAEQLLKEGAT